MSSSKLRGLGTSLGRTPQQQGRIYQKSVTNGRLNPIYYSIMIILDGESPTLTTTATPLFTDTTTDQGTLFSSLNNI